jgi:hypothetical protein
MLRSLNGAESGAGSSLNGDLFCQLEFSDVGKCLNPRKRLHVASHRQTCSEGQPGELMTG